MARHRAAPLLPEIAIPAVDPSGATPAARSPRIDVVDDDEAFRDSLRFLLVSAGYAVAMHESAEQFLASYVPGEAACLVLDVRLPGLSGLDLQRELRRRGDHVPIVFVSAHGGSAHATEAKRRGASHFLAKPFDDTELLRVLEQITQRGAPLGTSARPRPD